MYYWSNTNPHWITEIDHNNKAHLNVWAGILHNQIIGPIFYEGTLTGAKYLSLLQNEIGPLVEDLNTNSEIWFQQDGAPAHYHNEVVGYLNDVFPGHWIGRRGEIEWPPRSPDLNPLDFFLWGYLKQKVYKTCPDSLQVLRQRICQAVQQIPLGMLERVQRAIFYRLGYCQIQLGGSFEHLI